MAIPRSASIYLYFHWTGLPSGCLGHTHSQQAVFEFGTDLSSVRAVRKGKDPLERPIASLDTMVFPGLLFLLRTSLAGDAIPIGELERKEATHLAEFSEDRMAAGEAIAKTPALLLVERSGQIYSDAGLDFSNHPEGSGSLPPIDPNLAAKELREAIRTSSGIAVAVILSDTEVCLSGGSIDMARGSSGLRVIDHGLGSSGEWTTSPRKWPGLLPCSWGKGQREFRPS